MTPPTRSRRRHAGQVAAEAQLVLDEIAPQLARPISQHRVRVVRGRQDPICGVRGTALTLRVGRRWGRGLSPAARQWTIAAAVARRDLANGTGLFVLAQVVMLVALLAAAARVCLAFLGYGHDVTDAVGDVVARTPFLAQVAGRAIELMIAAYALNVIARIDLFWRGDRRAGELGYPIPRSVATSRLVGHGSPGYGVAVAIAAGMSGAALGYFATPAALEAAVQLWVPRFSVDEDVATIDLGHEVGLLCGLLAARAALTLARWAWSRLGRESEDHRGPVPRWEPAHPAPSP